MRGWARGGVGEGGGCFRGWARGGGLRLGWLGWSRGVITDDGAQEGFEHVVVVCLLLLCGQEGLFENVEFQNLLVHSKFLYCSISMMLKKMRYPKANR